MTERKILTASPVQGEALIIDEEKAKSLALMLMSRDTADHKMAQLILNTCDIEKSIYWIWRLSRKTSNLMVNLRTKAGRNFKEHSRLFLISQKAERPFAEFLNTQGWLTPEIYQRLEKDIIERNLSQSSNTFYNVSITIKDEYKHLTLTPDAVITSKKSEDED